MEALYRVFSIFRICAESPWFQMEKSVYFPANLFFLFMVFKKRKGIFIGITSILVLASIFMVPVFRYGESFAIRQYLLSFSNSEPESLSEILSYLEKPLSR